MTGFNELRAHNRITWIEQEHGWIAAPEDIVNVLSNEGFEECKRETTTSRRDRHPAGGLWQGVNTRTGSVASAIWVTRPAWQQRRRVHRGRWGVARGRARACVASHGASSRRA